MELVRGFQQEVVINFIKKYKHKNGYSPLWIHVKKLTEEETFCLKTYILYNNIWQQEGEQKLLFETY